MPNLEHLLNAEGFTTPTLDIFLGVYLKWGIILLLWLTFMWGAYRQHVLLRKLGHKLPVNAEMMTILKLFQERQSQLWIFVTLLTILTFTDEIHPGRPALPPVVAAPDEPVKAVNAPAPKADPFETALSKSRANAGVPFSEITEFNEQDSSRQAYIDLLKQRYETWLVAYYYLQKCGNAPASDLNVIQASLRKELASAHAQAADESNILMAARGSYSEMYSDIPCDAVHIEATKASYDANMRQINLSITPSVQVPAAAEARAPAP